MAKVLEIRPISVTENLQYNLMSRGAKLFWMVGTLIQMLSLTIFSLRVDRIWDKNYLSNHWKHYSGTISTKSFQKVLNTGLKMFLFFPVMVLITIIGWFPQILDFFSPGIIEMNSSKAYLICIFGLLYYMISVGLFLTKIAPFLRKQHGKAKTLRFWEIYVSIGK